MRRCWAVVAAILAVCLLAPPAAAAGGSDKKSTDLQAKQKAAQKRANDAAARLARAQTALSKAEDELADIEARSAETKQRLGALEGQVKELAVRQYMAGGIASSEIPFEGDLAEASRRQALVRYATLGTTEAIDEYRVAREDLEQSSADKERTLKQRQEATSALRKERQKIEKELAQLAEAQRKLEAEQRAAAERARQEAARRQQQNRAPSRATPAPPKSSGPAQVIGSGAWICPVQGPRAFSNDWGAPRSGGRRHQGNDIMSPNGTPVVASVSGTVRHHNSSLGGLSYYLNGDDGNTYFGTHLSSFGASGRVAAGTVVGRVGATGNARGGAPHLHFEIHPGGGGPVNPYPTLSKYC